MSLDHGLNRRTFLKSAGMTAVAGAVGARGALAGTADAPAAAADGVVYDFDTIYDRRGTDCIKWDAAIARYGDKVQVGMGIADMDFEAAPCITEALAERCKHHNWGYLATPKSYIDAIVSWNKKRYGLEIDPETIVIADGVHPGLIAALRTFSPPGTKVLLTTPTYNGFYGDVRATQTIAEDSPMTLVNGRYSIDWDDLESRISVDTNSLILCNPQNPTGNCWSQEDLLRLGRMCLEHRVVVLADEIHCDFVMKGQKYTPFASLPDRDVVNNSLTFKAVSKTFSLAAMKNAWFFSTNPEYLRRVRMNHRANTNTLGAVANEAGLTQGEDWLDQLLVYIDGNHSYVESYCKEKMPLVDYTKAHGTYLAWLDVSKVIDRIGAKEQAEAASKSSSRPVSAESIAVDWFVEHAGVALNAGTSYGTGGEGHMRMNLGTSRQLIQKALDNMAEALSNL
jgi:cystathionine beta-lyase